MIYKVSSPSRDGVKDVRWASSAAAARAAKAEMCERLGHSPRDCVTEQLELPPGKARVLAWLNANCHQQPEGMEPQEVAEAPGRPAKKAARKKPAKKAAKKAKR